MQNPNYNQLLGSFVVRRGPEGLFISKITTAQKDPRSRPGQVKSFIQEKNIAICSTFN